MLQSISYRGYDPAPVQQLLDYGISQEGLADVAASVKDVVGHAFRTVKVNIKNIKKDYVQSDFQQYYSANRSKINLLLKNPIRKLNPDTFLPMPDGMAGTYCDVTELLCPFVMQPFGEITKKSEQCVKDLKQIVDQNFPKEELRSQAIVSKIESFQFKDIIAQTDNLKDKLPKMFVKGRVTSSTVGEQFKDKKELNKVIDRLLACGDRYKEFIKHQNDIRKVENSFHQLVDSIIRRDRKMKKEEKKVFSEVLYEFVKSMALFNDYYGIALNEILRIENKFMLCMTQMINDAK